MLTWRYHLLTLVAIFLALGLGVLLGISLSDTGVVETGRSGLVEDIQRNLRDLSNRNDKLSSERSVNLRYQDDTFPFIVGGHTQGARVAVIASSSVSDQIVRDLGSAINSAGGQVASITRLNSRFDATAATEQVSTSLAADPVLAKVDESTFAGIVGPELAADISRGGGPALATALQGSLVDSTSGSYDSPVNAVLLINNADDEQAPAYAELERQIILGLRGLGVMAIGAEPSDAAISEIPMFISTGISSVDNVESRIGQVSIIYLLGGERGTFGVKPTADLLIPILRPASTGTPAT